MSINTPNQNNNQNLHATRAAAQPQGAPQGNGQPQGNVPPQKQKSDILTTLKRLGNNYVAQSTGGQFFTDFREATTKLSAELIAEELTTKIYGINASEYNLKFSAVVMAVYFKAQPDLITYHTLLLEATGEKLGIEQIRGSDNMVVPVRRVTSDAIDSVLMTLADDIVRRTNPGTNVFPAGSQVVPSTVEITNTDMVGAIIRNAAMACVSQILVETKSFDEINLAEFAKDYRLDIQVLSSNNHVTYDEVGAPQRSSAVITTSIASNARQAQRVAFDIVNTEDNNMKFSEVTGFLNPVWAPLNSSGAMYYHQQQTPTHQPKLAAEFVITSIRTPFATSPAAVLLSAASAYALADRNTWMQLLIPQGQYKDEGKPTDFGALNILCDVQNEKLRGEFGSAASIASTNGDIYKLSSFISAMFHDGMVLSIDCPEATTQSWYTNLFVADAIGFVPATQQIIDAANELTAGKFSDFYDGSGVFSSNIRVPLGYYVKDGQKRDIRDVDLTYISNTFKGQPEQIKEYCRSLIPFPGKNEAIQMAEREQYTKHALASMEITGFARRLTFNASFLKAFSAAIDSTHINTQLSTPLSADQIQQGMSAPDYIQQSLVSGTRTFTNHATQINRPMFTNYANTGVRR